MLWKKSTNAIEQEIGSKNTITWIHPLKYSIDGGIVTLNAPNRFVCDYVKKEYLSLLQAIIKKIALSEKIDVNEVILSYSPVKNTLNTAVENFASINPSAQNKSRANIKPNLNKSYTLDNFIEGRSNQIAHQAAIAIAQNPKQIIHNPLFIYGGTGLGKTHLMHAIGNALIKKNKKIRISYFSSEVFVRNFVHAIHNKKMEQFKEIYRSLDVLLIDDIQFLANKTGTQEEFFYTFNYLFESNQQIVLTADRYPQEIEGVDSRLKSRLSCGLTVRIEPPEVETRAAIIMSKAKSLKADFKEEVAFFVAEKINSNVRDIEGAVNLIVANAGFLKTKITRDFCVETLKDMFAAHDKLISIENIQKQTTLFYNVSYKDLISATRTRSIARPRQVAMYLSKELTGHSLPEIGQSFGGRNHSTVLHAHKQIKKLKQQHMTIRDDISKIINALNS